MTKRIILAPDSFKGSLSAMEAAAAMEAGLRQVWPDADIRQFPMADGGEGTLDVLLAVAKGKRCYATVAGVDGLPLQAAYGVLEHDGKQVAVLETAQVVGLPLAGQTQVAARTTFGLGELFRICLDLGIRHFMVGLGGSSTNDGGAGVLAALGVALLNVEGKAIQPDLNGLMALDRVDFTQLDPRVAECSIIIMSDVRNALCGPDGATAVFGPQKGMASAAILEIDGRLKDYAALCDAALGQSYSALPGTGAAGGLGYAFQLLGGVNRSGAEMVCELSGIDAVLLEMDWVVTGEGKTDAQTLMGKVPYVVAAHARHFGVPVTLVSGSVEQASLPDIAKQFDGCFSIMLHPMTVQEAMANAAPLLTDTLAQLARLMRTSFFKD
ncbi:glycerate kinase [Sulfurirhabdus autotrophica]|uniref:Glycerate kinase n=1 Tax=Sulfurirhabdus autotrophica TaxID=1706046 RepID=A0A4R3XXC5_9PROT|nr:glycerate kinase [Sulfurirhabdus autotrophica]TCV82918.1 glycerate kinase [Sulfurirhabdus autotrophica]